MYSKSDNTDIVIYDKADEVIQDLFQSPFSKYQIGLEISMKGRDFIFDCVNVLYHKCHKIYLKRSGSYINSLD